MNFPHLALSWPLIATELIYCIAGHQLIHTGEKQHKCDVCGKSFTLRSNLTVHMRLHTGETPYHCNVCGKKFYDSNGLKRHRLVHERNNQEKSNEPKPTQEKNETICVSQTIENNSVIISNESDTAQIKVEMPSECGSAMIYTISKWNKCEQFLIFFFHLFCTKKMYKKGKS